MARKSTGRPHGGARANAGRPKGSKSKSYKPHLEKLLAVGGISPRDVLLDIMRRHYRARRWDAAEHTAALVAPFVHPRLTAASVAVKRSIAEEIIAMSDEELADHIRELEELSGVAGMSDDEKAEMLAKAKPRGSA
jgi:hypothetical protein